MVTGRALHFVFKVGNRTQTARFYRDILGMKVYGQLLIYINIAITTLFIAALLYR